MWNRLTSKHARLAWVALGLAGGLALAVCWPSTPLHAVATDRSESFAMCTGYLDLDVEAVYFLDFLTGDLRAAALSKQTGQFHAFYQYNVNADLGVDPSKSPRYMMVTGVADLRTTAGRTVAPSKSICYVAEVTSGMVAAYAIPWSPSLHMTGAPIRGALRLMDKTRFRTPAAPAGGS